MTILETKNLKKIYGKGETEVHALDGVDLSVEKGEFVAIVGTSGSGKSTLLHMLGGLDRPTSGSVTVDGRELSKLKDEELTVFRRRKIGFVFQNYNLVPVLSVYENIVLPIQLDGNREDEAYVKKIIETLGLEKKLNNLPNKLSGGQQQRVAIARALVKTPNVLLLDEPLSNLDARLRLQTREEIRRIQRETKLTTVFVTHDQEEALSISDLIVVMKDGVLQQTGKPQEVYDSPANLFVAKFLGTPPINLFAGRVSGGKLWIGDEAVLDVQEAEGQEVTVGIRPEGFLLKENGALGCSLNGVEVLGRDISVVCSHPACSESAIRAIIDSDNLVDTRSRTVCFDLKPEKVFLFDPVTGKRILMANGDKKAEGAAAGRGSAV